MQQTLSVATAAGAARKVVLKGYPSECPRCHSKIVPKLLASATRGGQQSPVEQAFQCSGCNGIFVAIFEARPQQSEYYDFRRSIPLEPKKPELSDLVTALSPGFSETYSQVHVAEAHSLQQLTGIGLRKALEFLVKDFACSVQPDKTDEILKKPLAACIADYIDEPQVREVAKRATWLGNDETHYVRKWEDKDVADLKILIRLTINGIDNVLLTKKYMDEMPGS